MTFFLLGVVVGGLGMYGWLWHACNRAAERFEKALKDEVNHRS